MNTAENLRRWAMDIRRHPAPISEAIPIVQTAADELDALAARLAEVTEERDALRVTLDMVLHIPNMTNDQLEELKARCQKIIDGATDSATACGVCKGTGFHPGPYMCVICGGTGSTASAEHRHIYKHNADDTYGICECGKAFKVCPSCGMEIDATGETVDAVQKEER